MKKNEKQAEGIPASKKGLSKFVYYSGMGFQMIAIIGVFTFIGHKIDAAKGNEKPILTAVFGLLGVALSLYSVIKSLINKKSP